MKRSYLTNLGFTLPEKGMGMTVQLAEGRYLILNRWDKEKLQWRHAVNRETGEYATHYPSEGKWTMESLRVLLCGPNSWYMTPDETAYPLSPKDRMLIEDHLPERWGSSVYARVTRLEEDYGREKREEAASRKKERIARLMAELAKPDEEIKAWIADRVAGEENYVYYAFWRSGEKRFGCSACGATFREAAGKKIKNKQLVTCPHCGVWLIAEKRRAKVTKRSRLSLIQDMDQNQGVERHFMVTVKWSDEASGAKRTVDLNETIRVLLLRDNKKWNCRIYYRQWDGWGEANWGRYKWECAYLYPKGVREGLKGTAYSQWAEVLAQMAEAGARADYNSLLRISGEKAVKIVEYLLKGRFTRLLDELSKASPWMWGEMLLKKEDTVEGILGIRDRQKINRLREKNGGLLMWGWLQWQDKTGGKISDQALEYFDREKISAEQYKRGLVSKHLTPEQLKNYLIRQKEESYPKRQAKTVLEEYEDYLQMAENLGKDMGDEMVYRPRELKRRHDELVEECKVQREALLLKEKEERAREEAEKMREKYPGSEEILAEIRPKLEYADEDFRIIVPQNLVEITMEGAQLHHCVGFTERYFDRIVQRETYICFLRRAGEPEKPFYTIEVEPGGTIRQHRGYLDEEPGIEEIRPFLRKWQREIRKRMSRKDYEDAAVSAVKREQNMEELRQKNNTRVLEALLQDLMEVG